MGRKRNIVVREFFEYNKSLNVSTCKTCKATFNGDNVTNLKRHMTNIHFDLYSKEVESVESQKNKKIKLNKKFSVTLSVREVENACLEFLTKQSQPLSFFDTAAFKTLTSQLFEGLEMTPISSNNICEILSKKYYEIKQHITDLAKGNIISIKMDSATRNNRSVLGINMQIIENKR